MSSDRKSAAGSFRPSTFRRAARRAIDIEGLETRRLFCALHDVATDTDIPLTSEADIAAALAKTVQKGKVLDHAASWYKPAKQIEITSLATSAGRTATSSAVPVTTDVTTNAAGLPLLTSRADGAGLKIFLDFDGNGTSTPYDTDGDGTTFDPTEQKVVYDAWRDVVSFFAPLNVNVTTIQPSTGGTNPVFAWQVIANNGSGTAYVGTINNSSARGWNAASSARGRTSAIAHELGHQLNLYHQGVWATDGTQTAEYSSGYTAHGPLIGSDYAEEIHKWIHGRTGADVFVDDLARMASYVAGRNTSIGYGDGYRPDDFTGTALASATTLSQTDGAYQTTGIIERIGDADFFKFTSAGGTFNVNVEPIYESGLAPKLELYDGNGKLIATKDTTGQRAWEDNTGQEFTLDLAAGTYTAKISSHGDYGDQGEYAFYAAPLPAGWRTQDVTDDGTGRGGYVTHNGLAGAAGAFEQGGGGSFIGNGGIGSLTSGSSALNEDDFRFTYQILTGDGSITARVTNLDNTAAGALTSGALAGVMVRETLADDARMAFVGFSPTASRTVYRTTAAGAAVNVTGSNVMPGWVRLTRTGNLITFARSTDGVTFTNTSTTVTLSALAGQVYVGLAVTSGTSIELATAGFDNVSLVGSTGATVPTYNTLPAPTGLTAVPVAASTAGITAAWNAVAGATSYLIERSTDNVNWATLTTTANTTYTSTPFGGMRYWYRVSANDATGRGAPSASVSVINKPSAPINPLAVTISTTKLSLSWRDVSGESSYRIEKSIDGGVNYTSLGTTTTTAANINGINASGLTINTTYTFRVTPVSAAGDGTPLVFSGTTAIGNVSGFAFTAKTAAALTMAWTATAGATGYLLERSPDNATWATLATLGNVTAYTDNTVAPLNHYYYRLTATNSLSQSTTPTQIFTATPPATPSPSPWADADIGTVSGEGAGFISGTTATVLGGGLSLVGSGSDAGNFLYRTLTGDGEMIARVASLENLNEYTKAGIWFRESLAAGSRYAGILQQSTADTQGTDMSYRTTLNGTGSAIQGPADIAAAWLRVVRAGNVLTTYASTTGAAGSWTTVGSVTISNLAPTLYVGLYASARDDDFITKATFTNVSVTPASVPTVTSMVVNGGQAQRSSVTSIAVNFSGPVNAAADAIALYRTLDGATTRVTDLVVTASPTKNVYTLTFPSLSAGSLLDGAYEVRVTAAGVTSTDGNAMAADVSLATYRLFGDIDASRTVDFNDFLSLQTVFGSPATANPTAAAFDSDGSGTIDFNDFLALQVNFGKTI